MPSLFSNINTKNKSIFSNVRAQSSDANPTNISLDMNHRAGSNLINKSTPLNAAQIIFSIGLFALPFLFLPFTSDISSLNKSYFVMLLAFASLMAYLLNGWQKGNLNIKDFGAYLPALALLVAGSLSVFFSISQMVSLYGQNGNYSYSFVVLVAMVIISFVSANTDLRPGRLLGALIAGTTVSSVLSWMGMYSLTLPVIGTMVPGFTLTDSFGGLLGLQLVASLGAFYLMLKSRPVYVYVVLGLVAVINMSYGLSVFDMYYVAGLILGLAFLASTSDVSFRSKTPAVVSVLVAIVAVSAFHLIPGAASNFGFARNVNIPRMDLISSWQVTGASIIDTPLFGTGLGTYANSYTRFRPAFMNGSVFWNAVFQYPFNDLFLWLSTAGLVGAIGYLAFVFLVSKKAWAVKNNKHMYLPAMLAIVSIISALLLGGSLALSMLMFILAGLLYRNEVKGALNVSSKGTIMAMIVVVLGVFGFMGLKAYRVYAAQMAFKNSLTSESLIDRHQMQRFAITQDPYESSYYREAILTNLAVASRLSEQENLTDEQKAQIQELLIQAVNDSRVITEMIDSRNSANWEVRGTLYRAIIGLDKEKNQFTPLAQQSYMNAIETFPTNPRLYVDLGGIYYANKDYQNAVNYFARAVQLKSDYTNAYYNLAYALKDGQAYSEAVTQMEIVKRLVQPDSEAAKKVEADLAEFKKLADEAAKKAADSKVAVPEVKGPAENTKSSDNVITTPGESSQAIDPDSNVDVDKIESVTGAEESVNTQLNRKASPTPTGVPSADGSDIDRSAGQKDAPIANPQ